MTETKNTPEVVSTHFASLAARSDLPRTLMGGTKAMRASGAAYLPKHPAEEEKHWDERLKMTVLRNFFKKTVKSMTGKVFADPFSFGDDVPDAIKDWGEDIDLCGTKIQNFAMDLFRDAMVDGLAFIFVDYPMVNDTRISRRDEVMRGYRPYWLKLTVRDILGIRFTIQGGRPVINQLRFRERVTEEEGPYDEVARDYIRVVTPEGWERWKKNEKGEWIQDSYGSHSLGKVALVPIYTERNGHYSAEPPLEELAELNLEHWQIRSDQRWTLKICSFPVLVVTGVAAEEKIKWGPNQAMVLTNPNAKVGYAESNGAHLAAGAKELEALEDQMMIFGFQFETKQGAAATATGRSIDAAEAMAPLQKWAQNLKDGLEAAMGFTADWAKLNDGGSIAMNLDFLANAISTEELKILQQARATGEISREAFLGRLKEYGLLGDDYDAAADKELIDDDAGDLGGLNGDRE